MVVQGANRVEQGPSGDHERPEPRAKRRSLEERFAAVIDKASHELNTPLTPLRIHADALGEMTDLTPEQRGHLDVIERNVLRLCGVVKGMLDASRLETGRFRFELDNVPVASVIRETVQSFGEQASQAGVTLEAGPLARAVATADRNRVGQVLTTLLTNAINFTPRGGRISVSATLQGGQVVVRVTDTGIGLSAIQIGQLFQPFSRPHESSGSAPRGTGLGLFVAKGIIEQHGGYIWAESAGPEAGSSFCFSLPLADQAKKRADLPPEAPLMGGATAEPGGYVVESSIAATHAPRPSGA